MNSLSAFRSELRSDPESQPDGARLSQGLGYFSLGLGLTEVIAPRLLAKAIGIDPGGKTAFAMRAMGLREIAAGIGILMQPRRPVPVATRVFGDLVDLAMLGWAAKSKRESTPRLLGAVGIVLGAIAIDAYAAKRVAKSYEENNRPVMFSVTINKAPLDVYNFWRKLEQLPLFMDWLESVKETSSTASHWVAKLPIGGTAEWDAEITEDRPGELIAWKSVEGSAIAMTGKVTFATAPGRASTEVRVEMAIAPVGMRPSALIAKLTAKPQVKADLRRFKQIMETGEVLFSDASRHAKPHPAQPSTTGRRAEYTNPAPRSQVSSSTVRPRSPEPALAASSSPPPELEPKKGYVS